MRQALGLARRLALLALIIHCTLAIPARADDSFEFFDPLTYGEVGIFADDDAAVDGLGYKPVDFTVNNFRAGPPAPLLSIQQTVTLSWPDSYAGYVLRSAADLSGPWQPLSVTPLDSAGNYTVTVAATNSAQLFQLYQP